jgi:replication factor C small subunit
MTNISFEMWTEKYRPKTLSEVRGQDDIINRLKAFVSSKSMPHMLFAGMQGTGKTTSFLSLARDLYGDTWKDNVLELNASDDRGINIVRTLIKDFARTKAVSEKVPFKLIFLDEADALTKDAQHALRRTMEDYASNVRFCLSCNYSSKIIPPIQSRCAMFRFQPLNREVIVKILKEISILENISIQDDAANFIYDASEGDCRKAENMLQACSAITNEVTVEVVREVVAFAEPTELYEIIKLSLAGDFNSAKNKMSDILIKYGLSGMDAIRQIQKQVWNSPDFNDKLKVQLIKFCGEYEYRLTEGANEFVQLNAFLAEVVLLGSNVSTEN